MISRRAMQVIWFSFATAIVARFLLPLLFGLFDNDGVNLLIAARGQAEGGGWNATMTLPTFLISLLFRAFGVKLWAARILSAASAIGAMIVLVRQGDEIGDPAAGLLSATLFAAAPVAVFFGAIDSPYALLTLLGIYGVWALSRALTYDEPWLGAAAGLAWGGAFLCKTFAAVFVFPAVAFCLQGLWLAEERRRRQWVAPLAAVAFWAAVVGATVVWRWPTFGWSVFNDSLIDWRFRLAETVWSARWEDLVNVHSLAPALFAPGIVLSLLRRDKTTFEKMAWLFVAADVGVFLLNPVNHFPRVLLPAIPALAWFSGRELARAIEQRQGGVATAWGVAAVALLAARLWRPAWHLDARPWLGLIEFAVGGAALAACAAAWPPASARAAGAAAAAAAAAATAFGLLTGYGDLDRVERLYMARVEAVKFAGVSNGILNGGDVVALVVRNGKADYPSLLDLPRDRLAQMFRDGLPAVMREMKLVVAVDDRADTEGALAMLAPIAAEAGGPAKPADPFAALADDSAVSRLFDNGRFALDRLDGVTNVDGESWPEWSRVEPTLDRTGRGVIHPTAEKLVISARPELFARKAPDAERRVVFEFTDLPEGPGVYHIELSAKDRAGRVLWEEQILHAMSRAHGAPGVAHAQFTVTRAENAAPGEFGVPGGIGPVATIQARVIPAKDGTVLWTYARMPPWW